MADNFVTDPGAAGVTFASDDIGGVHYPLTKLTYGALDSQTIAASGAGAVTGGVPRFTLASDDPAVALLTTIDADTSALAGTVSGSELQVDIIAPLPAGTNGIGKLTANSGVDIGDVDVTSVIPGVGATNLGKSEDGIHSTGDVGVMALAVRNDTPTTFGSADGDYVPLHTNSDGVLWTDVPDALADTNNSTTTLLTANTDFTGTATDIMPYAGIAVNVFADQDSDPNGMRFQFSSDGTNWDIEVDSGFDYVANTSRTFQFDVLASYFRVIFQNGASGQGVFRMQTLLQHHTVALTTIHRLDDSLAPDRSATVTKSVLMAQAAGTGDFDPIQATTGGNLKVSVEEISNGLDVGAGNAGAETQRVSISTDDINQAAINASAATIAGAVSGTEMQVDVLTSALPTGAATAANQLADGHNVTVDNGAAGAAVNIQDGGNSITVDGSVTADLGANNDVTISAAATGGMSYTMLGIAAADNDVVIKASAATIYFISIQSIDATPVYLKLFNLASFTPGTSTADLQYLCPANATAALGAGIVLNFGASGIQFDTGLCALIATGFALDDNTAVSANEVVVTIGWE